MLAGGCAGLLGIHDPEIDPEIAGQQDGSASESSTSSGGEGGADGSSGGPGTLSPVAAPVLVVTLAGTGDAGNADGVGAVATFGPPQSMAFDEKNLYVADSVHGIRMVSLGGDVSTVDAKGVLQDVRGVAVQSIGPTLYATDYVEKAVWQIPAAGAPVKILADYGVDGGEPTDLLVEGATLYVSEEKNKRIRRVPLDGGPAEVLTDAGLPLSMSFTFQGMASGKNGIYVADSLDGQIMLISRTTGEWQAVAGKRGGIKADGPGSVAVIVYPRGLAIDANDTLYISDSLGNAVRTMFTASDGGTYVTTLAGGGVDPKNIDGPADKAYFLQPRGIAVDAVGENVYVADLGDRRIRKIMKPGPGALAVSWNRIDDPSITQYVVTTNDVTVTSCSAKVPGPNHCVIKTLTSGKPYTIKVTAFAANDRVVATGTTTATPD